MTPGVAFDVRTPLPAPGAQARAVEGAGACAVSSDLFLATRSPWPRWRWGPRTAPGRRRPLRALAETVEVCRLLAGDDVVRRRTVSATAG